MPTPLNKFHESDAANSHAWGLALSGPIELALMDIARVCNIDAGSACTIAEAIIENAAGADAFLDIEALYAGALEGSPLYRAANLEWLKQRAASVAQAVAA